MRLLFQDEARFGRIHDPKRCWAPYPMRPTVSSQMIREYTYAYGAVCPFDGVADFLILPFMTAVVMNRFLEEVAKRHCGEYILMIYDGAPCHELGALTIPKNMMIEKLPPYSAELNPVEHVWEEVREKFFKNYVFNSMDAVEEKLIEALCHLENNPELVKSITGFKWIVNHS